MRPRRRKHQDRRMAACEGVRLNNPTEKKGAIRNLFPHPEQPLHLEIGYGKGQFVTTLASQHPEINYIAMEREEIVGLVAMEKAVAAGLTNVLFLIDDAALLSDIFEPGEIDRIYINFCDPWHKHRHYKRRLTYRQRLQTYLTLLSPEGEIHFKTDNEPLFRFSLGEFDFCMKRIFTTEDLHSSPLAKENIMTEYETFFSSKGMPIYSIHAVRK